MPFYPPTENGAKTKYLWNSKKEKKLDSAILEESQASVFPLYQKKCLIWTAQLWTMGKGTVPWKIYKNIAARQNKICRQRIKSRQERNVTFKGKIKGPMLKEAYFKAHENPPRWFHLNKNMNSSTQK